MIDCPHCAKEMIWGGDHDREEDETHPVESNFHCQHCDAYVLLLLPRSAFNG